MPGRREASSFCVLPCLQRTGGKETNSHSCGRGTLVMSGEGQNEHGAGSRGHCSQKDDSSSIVRKQPLEGQDQNPDSLGGADRQAAVSGPRRDAEAPARPAPGSRRPRRGRLLSGKRARPPRMPSALLSRNPRFCKLSTSHCYSAPPHQTSGWQLLTHCHQPPAAQHLLSAARKGTLKERVFKAPSSPQRPPHTRLHQHCCTTSSPPQGLHRAASECPSPEDSEHPAQDPRTLRY